MRSRLCDVEDEDVLKIKLFLANKVFVYFKCLYCVGFLCGKVHSLICQTSGKMSGWKAIMAQVAREDEERARKEEEQRSVQTALSKGTEDEAKMRKMKEGGQRRGKGGGGKGKKRGRNGDDNDGRVVENAYLLLLSPLSEDRRL